MSTGWNFSQNYVTFSRLTVGTVMPRGAICNTPFVARPVFSNGLITYLHVCRWFYDILWHFPYLTILFLCRSQNSGSCNSLNYLGHMNINMMMMIMTSTKTFVFVAVAVQCECHAILVFLFQGKPVVVISISNDCYSVSSVCWGKVTVIFSVMCPKKWGVWYPLSKKWGVCVPPYPP